MAVVMNMSGYEIGHEAAATEEYGDEVMCAGWNPELALIGDRGIAEKHAAFPPEMAQVDVEAFLQKMYRYQR
ncbi:hypothetical protein MIZ01_0127 [Sideroxyarcus emersonii]|uniref:Uncharacterized protein n=1 Tax=Sideroxyarcus emersonii TaxID=2764705 RepID=A0AAN1X876_9PROT|nr:hypothetical protein [Sideroxyarcus emersonii]BCK86372.1 hypothetical protein MIZ01_0127 [Sideroxyarcus emersonii]